jgi:hypothetical protein
MGERDRVGQRYNAAVRSERGDWSQFRGTSTVQQHNQ